MTLPDQLLIAAYMAVILLLGLRRAALGERSDQHAGYLLAGRRLTLPGFVATMVSTWYGGVLGVGEYSFKYGLSNWLVFGVPYYLAAALFAVFLADRARRSQALTLPEQLHDVYGARAGAVGAVVVLATTIPAAYVLTLGVLLKLAFGLDLWQGVLISTLFSVTYLWRGGFRSVVRTDVFQFALMFGGFALLLGTLVTQNGFLPFLDPRVPATHWTWHGGNDPQTIFVWYLIALATLAQPAFYQRCFAAKTPRVAKRGLLLSIVCWLAFDALTTFTGMYARAILSELPVADAAEAYPRLAAAALPPGLVGVFYVGLFATVMSTVDSYLFIAATTIGRDMMARLDRFRDRVTWSTRVGLVVSGAAALTIALTAKSVVRIWHGFGTVGTATLIIPVLGAFHPRLRMTPRGALVLMLTVLPVTLGWLLTRYLSADGGYFLGLEPIYPGLALGVAIWLTDRLVRTRLR